MWHETMWASCRPVWDGFYSFIAERSQISGSLKVSYSVKPISRLKPARLVSSAVQRGSICSDYENDDLAQRNYLGRILLISMLRIMSPPVWHGVAVSVPAQEHRRLVTVARSTFSSLTVTVSAVTTKETDKLGHATQDAGMIAERGRDFRVAESEKLRRQRISIANKGKVPWNKGCKHSAETINRIKEKTSAAMQSPTVTTRRSPSSVVAKLKQNARHSQTNETRIKIRDKLKLRWDSKKRIRGYQEIMVKEWKNCLAEGARVGGPGEEEMQWRSYSIYKKNLQADAVALLLSENANSVKVKPTRSMKSEEHRRKIAAAIRAKWEDPEYKSKVKQGMVKNSNAMKGQNRTPRMMPVGDSITSEAGCIKGPLDHGFLTAVMSGEKKRLQKENAAKEQKDESSAESAANVLRARNRKVDLLKRCSVQAEARAEDSSEDENTQGYTVSARHSFVDPRAVEKLFRLKLLQASRSVMDQRRKQATHLAKVLMAEAEQAARELETASPNEKFDLASLSEIYRLMAEAELFIQAAESLHKGIGGTDSHDGVSWKSTMAPYRFSKFQHQVTSQGKHGDFRRRGRTNELHARAEEIHEYDMSRRSGQDTALDMNETSVIRDDAQIMMFGNRMIEKAVWNVQKPFMDELRGRSRSLTTKSSGGKR